MNADSARLCTQCGALLAAQEPQADGPEGDIPVPAVEPGDDIREGGEPQGGRLAMPLGLPSDGDRPQEVPTVHLSLGRILRTCLVDKYFMLEGRASRLEYWTFFLIVLCVLWGSFVLSMMVVMSLYADMQYDSDLFFVVGCVEALLGLLFLLPMFSATVRRLHDTGHSGRYMWNVLLPVLGLVMLFACLAARSETRPNAYGPYVPVAH